jgi:hypothetical protein
MLNSRKILKRWRLRFFETMRNVNELFCRNYGTQYDDHPEGGGGLPDDR